LIVAGSRLVLKRTSALLQARKPRAGGPNGPGQTPCLETYLEHKVEDFVKGMRNGSARNLHPMLISAVERPLITLALQQTKGNQIQAAELLGLNRNTLRRKIQNLRIPVKRVRTH
jgi:two-component system nitrogen regulation response regulator GlnG